MKLPDMPSIDGRFEDLSIYVDNPSAIIYDVTDSGTKYTAGSDMYDSITVHYYEDGRGLAGNLLMLFRNQGEHFDTMIMVQLMGISVRSHIDMDGASVFTKFVQYLFDWMNEYIKSNNITDLKGNQFVLPHFHYSKERFPKFRG